MTNPVSDAPGLKSAPPAGPVPLPPRAREVEDGSEEEIALKAAAGDMGAFDALVTIFAGRVFAVAMRMLNDRGEAEDLAQEVFVTLHRALPTFRHESKVSTWIYRITKNRCLNRIKFLKRRHIGTSADIDDPTFGSALADPETFGGERQDPLQGLHQAQLSEVLEELLLGLPDEQRTLVILRDLEDLSYEEIVDVTGLALGTVKSRLHRARAQLARQLAKHPAASWVTP